MVFICTGALIILTCFSFMLKIFVYKNMKIFSLQLTFLSYWTIIVLFSSFHFFGLYRISDEVYAIVFIGALGFFIGQLGTLFGVAKYSQKKDYNLVVVPKNHLVFNKIFYLFLSLAIIVSFMKIRLLLPTIINGGISTARDMMQQDESMNLVGVWSILLFYFAKPFLRASAIVFLVNIFNKKIEITGIVQTVTLVLIAFLSDGGRGIILDIIFALIYLLWINSYKISRKYLKRIICAILLGIIAVLCATIQRKVGIFSTFYIYYCGGLRYFTDAINKEWLFSVRLKGMACFQGFLNPIFGFLKLIGLSLPDNLKAANAFLMDCQAYTVFVAPAERMNYFMTSFGYAYKDGGIVGVFIIHFLLSVICGGVDKLAYYKSQNIGIVSCKVILLSGIMFTMSIFPFAKYYNIVSYLYVIFICSKFCSKEQYTFS